MLVQGVSDRAKTIMYSTSHTRNSNEFKSGLEQDEMTGVCNTPLSNLNWMIAGHFLINGYKNPFDSNLSAVGGNECPHYQSCYDPERNIGVTYINIKSEEKIAPNIYVGEFHIMTYWKEGEDPIETIIEWDGRD